MQYIFIVNSNIHKKRKKALEKAIEAYNHRERRYGGLTGGDS